MGDEIITALVRCSWLGVVAGNSSFAYRSKSVDIRKVGRKLGARYVFEGSIRRSSNNLRFIGRLTDAMNGVHIWADRFETKINDVFEVQDEFTKAVARAIEHKIQIAEIERRNEHAAASVGFQDVRFS